jgi:integrase
MAVQYYISSNKYSLQERQTKLNGKVYDLAFRVITIDGEEKQIRRRGFKTKTLAKEYYLQFVTNYCELVKNNPLKKKKVDKQEPTIKELFQEYIATLGNDNKFTTIYEKRNDFRIYILPYFGEKKPKQLNVQELMRWQDTVWNTKKPDTDEYYSYKYLSRIRGNFNTFLNWVEKMYGFKNYLPNVDKKKKRVSKVEMQFWEKDEFAKFIENVKDPMYHALFTFMFYTGRRKGELFALTPADVTPTTIRINKNITRKTKTDKAYEVTSTKAEKRQTLPVCKIVQKEIESYEPQSPFYFGGNKPLSSTTVAREFDKYTKMAGLKKIRIHDLRHSFVSMLIHVDGSNLMLIANLIGDTTEQVIRTYGHLYQSDMVNILSKID